MSFEPSESLPAALDDAEVALQRPMVRGQLVGLLRGLWKTAAEELEDGKDRVRWAELQIRVIDRLMKLYKLDAATVEAESEPDEALERDLLRRSVGMQLDELAEKGGAG